MEKEINIVAPEGYEIDKEKSTFECIKFKPIEKKRWRDDEDASSTWSKEDEETLCRIRAIVRNDNSSRVEDILWLKSLKERNTWKPSEEQIQALEYQVHSTYLGPWQYKASKELLEQLKKL